MLTLIPILFHILSLFGLALPFFFPLLLPFLSSFLLPQSFALFPPFFFYSSLLSFQPLLPSSVDIFATCHLVTVMELTITLVLFRAPSLPQDCCQTAPYSLLNNHAMSSQFLCFSSLSPFPFPSSPPLHSGWMAQF